MTSTWRTSCSIALDKKICQGAKDLNAGMTVAAGCAGRLTAMVTRLTGTGIWSGILRYGDQGEAATFAAEFETLGYTALWIPDVGGDLFGPLDNLLGATTTATIATGILNVWMHTAEETAAEHARLTTKHGPRFLCGIGISHRPFVDHVKEPGTYRKPIETMAAYLDGLDAAVPRWRRRIASSPRSDRGCWRSHAPARPAHTHTSLLPS